MKTRNMLAFWLMAFAIIMTSCDKKESNDDDDGNFSTIPVEQHKTNIENTGYDMFDEMKLMEAEPAMQTNISFVTFLSNSSPFDNGDEEFKKVQLERSIAFAPIFASANFKETGVNGMLKSMQLNPTEEPDGIQDVFDELVGIYEWNLSTEEWNWTQTGDKIIFLFPSEENGTTNNASYTISYEGYTGPNPIEDYDGDLPQKVTADLKVDNAIISSFLAEMQYNSEGYPTLIEVTYTIGAYEWYAMASNANNTKFDTEFSFKHSSKILLKFMLGASGNWTKDNIEANWNEETIYYKEVYDDNLGYWQWVEVSETDDWDYYETDTEFDVHKVVKNGNASFQIMDLKVAGAIDIEGFGNKMIQIDETYDWDTQGEEIVNEEVKAINEYISLSLRYADTDDVIAFVEAYPVSETYSYESYYYNGEWHDTPMTVTETDYWFDMRFVFSDDSKVDAETYFDDVFEDLISDLEDYLDELEGKYGK